MKHATFAIALVAFCCLALAAPVTDNQVFVRAWAKTFPGAPPLTAQSPGVQSSAKSYGEAVLWAAANPEQPETPPTAGGARELIVTTGHGLRLAGAPITSTVIRAKHYRAAPGNLDSEGLRIECGGGPLLVEDCIFEGYAVNVNLSPLGAARLHDVTFRRCLFLDAHGDDHSQGMFARNTDGLLLEECVFSGNGEPSNFAQGSYITNGNTGVVVRHCLFANVGNYQLQLRCGGTVTGCIFYDSTNVLRLGGGGDDGLLEAGVAVDVTDNLIIGGVARPGITREGAVTAGNILSGRIARTLLIGPNDPGGWPLLLAGDRAGIGLGALIVSDFDRVNWPGAPLVDTGGKPWTGSVQGTSNSHAFDRSPFDAFLQLHLERGVEWGPAYEVAPMIAAARGQVGL